METIVLIPHYNNKHILDECLNSLKKQTYKDFKTVVVDDGSTDGSADYIRKRFPEVDVHALGENRGFARTINEGVRYALGQYRPAFIAILNNDTRVDENWLAALINRISTNRNIAAITSNMFFADHPEIINSQGGTIDWNGDGYDVNFGVQQELGKKESGEVLGACWGASLVRADALQAIGLLDESFGAYFEDLDWSWRANLLGYRVVFEKNAIVYHKHSASYRNNNYKKLYLCKRNALRAALKNYESKNLSRQVAYILLGYWFAIVGYFQADRRRLPFLKKFVYATIPLAAVGWNLFHLPDTLRKRRSVQQKRVKTDADIDTLIKSDRTPVRLWLENLRRRWWLLLGAEQTDQNRQPAFSRDEIFELATARAEQSGSRLQRLLLSRGKSPFLLRIFSKMYLEKGRLAHFAALAHRWYNRYFLKTDRIHRRHFPVGVNIFGFLDSESGVGEAGRTLVRTIDKTGLPVALINSPHAPHRRQERQFARRFGRDNPYTVNLIAIYGDMFARELAYFGEKKFRDRYNVAYWTWELERFPQEWLPLLDRVNEVWTPSNFAAAAVRQARPGLPVTVIPHAIEVPRRRFPRARFGLPDNRFLFLFMFDFYSIFERKNPLAVIRAFRNAFQKNDPVGLVIKCSNPQIDPVNFQILKEAAQDKRIHIIDSYLKREEVAGLMNACDAYVSLHRAEGFGLTMAEAMTLGKPVVATNYSSNTDFMDEENSFPVNYKMVKIRQDYGPYRKGNVWAEPDEGDAVRKMRLVYENQEVAARKGGRAAMTVNFKLSPAAVAVLAGARLKECFAAAARDGR